jgi:hypothetical protein
MTMSNVEKLSKLVSDIVNTAKNGGIAVAAVYMGDNKVMVKGREMVSETIVPITVLQGQRVIVQVSANDNKAYIIG